MSKTGSALGLVRTTGQDAAKASTRPVWRRNAHHGTSPPNGVSASSVDTRWTLPAQVVKPKTGSPNG